MLHIVGLILKIIGILLLVILGIIVLLLCTVLFVPIKYDVKAAFPGKVEEVSAEARVTWLLRLIRADISYAEKELKWKAKVAWLQFGSDVEEKPAKKEKKPKKKEEAEKKETLQTEQPSKETEKLDKSDKPQEQPLGEKSQKVDSQKHEPEKEGIKSLFERIKCTFQKIYDKIKEGIEIKDKLVDFLENRTHKAAFTRVMKELVWIKRLLRVKGGHINLRFGFEDPSLTGKALAGLSVLYPFLGDNMNIQPEFEEVCMEGDIHLKGHIRFIHLAMMAFKLLFDKNVHRTFKDAMKLKDQLI